MKTTCLECNNTFTASEALREDWRDPQKSFGCPACGTFFIKETKPKLSQSLVGGLLAGGIVTPALFIFVDALGDSDMKLMTMAAVVIVSAFGILIGQIASVESKRLIVSPYRRDANDPRQKSGE